jgi:hypothetical protein
MVTPHQIDCGLIPGGAYELSKGEGIFDRSQTVYGVSVVRLDYSSPTGTRRDYTVSRCFHSYAEAQAFIKALREGRETEERWTQTKR